jgi:hypothetical protein
MFLLACKVRDLVNRIDMDYALLIAWVVFVVYALHHYIISAHSDRHPQVSIHYIFGVATLNH